MSSSGSSLLGRSSFHRAALILAFLVAPTVALAAGPEFHPEDFDTTCSPCRDFNEYANGGWLKRTKIPAGYTSYSAFTEVADRNQQLLRGILEAAAADHSAKPGSDRAKLGTYYSTCMDSAAAEAEGARPIEGFLTDVAAISSTAELGAKVGWLHANGIPAIFGFFANQDPKHSDEVIAIAGQGGLGMPDRGYYLRSDSAAVAARDVYRSTTAHLLELVGEDAATAKQHADAILGLETSLAKASMTNVQRRDPQATYHRMPWDSLRALTPAFDWNAYAKSRHIGATPVNVTQPDFFRAVNGLIGTVPLDTWKAYLRAHVVRDAAPTLSTPFVNTWFSFQQALRGADEMLPRWKRCIASTNRSLGDMLGKEYVKEYFTPADKARMRKMVKNLEAGLGDRIRVAAWMDDATRAAAAHKLAAFDEKIGYPDHWRDYSTLVIKPGPFYANVVAAQAFELDRIMKKIGKPVDRGEWRMTAPTVNAFYSPSLNSINFPAGILQPPFFDSKADDATNYGAIGAVIGHEMSHGFDDHGRQFDAKGNLREWWKPADVERFKVQANKVREQFSGYTVLDTLHLNGSLTLGENIADLGGLAVAYAAMAKAYAGRMDQKIDGFTAPQRFFLGWAHVWHQLQTDAALRTQVLTNPHSPGVWRINGPLSNLDEFRKAFGCKEGDPMVRPKDEQARIW